MIVEQYLDHLAYTFEKEDEMFRLGMTLVNKLGNDLIPMVEVSFNESYRLLYGLDGLKPVHEVIEELKESELGAVFNSFISFIKKVKESDFLEVYAIDINYNRLFYDVNNKMIKVAVLPINYECNLHDGLSWSKSFRRTLLFLLNKLFINSKEKYSEAYYYIRDESKSDNEIIKYVSNLNLEIVKSDSATFPYGKEGKKLTLEHISSGENIVIVVNKANFILGKGKDTDGTINISSNVSRKHCEILTSTDSYIIKDLNSTNGTTINGFTLNPGEYYYVKNGDKLKLADVEFIVNIR